jgi:hypothetical protein
MKLYPDTPDRRWRTIIRDVVVVLLLLAFAWVGLLVHDAVDALSVLGTSLVTAGETIESGFESTAGAIANIPLLGDTFAEALRDTGAGSGGELAELGEEGVRTINRLAITLGLVVFCLPAGVVLLFALPGRIRQVKELTAAGQALATLPDAEHTRLLAMRAVFSLPYGTLARYSADPFGDLAAGRYDGLVEAALDEAGVRPPARANPAGNTGG